MYPNSPPPYYDNNGYQPEYSNIYDNPVPPNVYQPYPIPPPYVSQVPQYLPQVTPHQAVTVNQYASSKSWFSLSKRKITCIAVALIFLVVAIIIAAVLCWYFLTTHCPRKCGTSSSCVRASQWCDGTLDCPGGEDEAYCVRLYGQNFILQAYSPTKSAWLSVCFDDWRSMYGSMVCQAMGYKAYSYYNDYLEDVTSDLRAFASINTSVPFTKLYRSIRTRDYCPSGKVVKLRCINCGVSTKQATSSRIVGGTSAKSGDWPWQVSLQVRQSHVCGGSIITPDWILTAAHCVEGNYVYPSLWTAYAGSIQRSGGQALLVERIISHPNYNSETKDHDIALMKLKTSLSFTGSNIKPVCLPNAGMPWTDTQSSWISGWGYTKQGGTTSSVLMAANIPLISSTTCNSPSVYNGVITSTMICAGYLSGGVDTCQGDSGGPLVTKTNNLWWIVGDTSWGDWLCPTKQAWSLWERYSVLGVDLPADADVHMMDQRPTTRTS
ncbi:transmembrane protease serine 2 [Hyla sarda]|uniref:transmembrane protease serine 2 n=1 Tax=Hyla sarda TaxID=327740 RepID=UPI0024C26103|nr:transmembrane protease serine 2 [Hyla sarda]XP_056416888.1 transmembrane protease serine 2 [Hyla sarda]XP_056416889.1 transmembrane protease serine 2 [Hyla sarda]XP_056416890.1 transmembrane protease serine 2 [Hyla sarda]